jgi:hypothetical protein
MAISAERPEALWPETPVRAMFASTTLRVLSIPRLDMAAPT